MRVFFPNMFSLFSGGRSFVPRIPFSFYQPKNKQIYSLLNAFKESCPTKIELIVEYAECCLPSLQYKEKRPPGHRHSKASSLIR